MVHSVSGWTRGVQVKLWDPLITRVIPEHLRGVFMTRLYTNSPLPYLTPLGVWTTYDGHLGLIWKRIGHFLLVLIELFLLHVTAEVLLVYISSKSAISLQPKISGRRATSRRSSSHKTRAGSSMRLKPQGPGPDRGPDRPVQRKFTKYDHFGPRNL